MQEPPPWLATGPQEQPFDFCGHIQRLVGDIGGRSASLSHIQPERLLVVASRARNSRPEGLQAQIIPLRFPQGKASLGRCGSTYQLQRYYVGEREIYYLLSFCLPRFLDQDFSDKLITLFHELYHIAPECNGELRQHGGRYSIHSHSRQKYDRLMADLAREYLLSRPDPGLYAFLRLNFAQLEYRHGAVTGTMVPRPRLILVDRNPRPAEGGALQSRRE